MFTVAVAAPRTIYAFGGARYYPASYDGGKSWDRRPGLGFGITNAAFAGPYQSLVAGLDGFAVGRPGSWRGFRPAKRLVISAALLDARHVALLLATSGPGAVLLCHTSDGGMHWPSFGFAHLVLAALATAQGRFLLVASTAGTPSRPILASSVDGLAWHALHGVKATGSHCNQQGCRDAAGWRPFADLGAFTTPWIYPLPPDPKLYSAWAAVPGAVCDVGGTLRCALGGAQKNEAGPPPSPRRLSNAASAAACLRCPPPSYPGGARWDRIQGNVVLAAVISHQGDIANLVLTAAPGPALARATIRAVSRWRYQPTLVNGKPVTVRSDITIHFQLR